MNHATKVHDVSSGLPGTLAMLLTVAGLASLAAGCATTQTTQAGAIGLERKQYIADGVPSELKAASEKSYGQLVAKARAAHALNADAALVKRVQVISDRLIAQVYHFRPDAAQWDWEVNVFQVDEVNAACMTGGKILVYSGFIDKLHPSDDELAMVLGHEISHALREHAAETVSTRRRNSSVASIAGLVANTALAATTGIDLGSTMGDITHFGSEVFFSLPHDREQEREADHMGMELAARAGYDPRAASALWHRMAELGKGHASWLSTHPSDADRIADVERLAPTMLPLYEEASRSKVAATEPALHAKLTAAVGASSETAAADPRLLEPVEGVSLQRYAEASNSLFYSHDDYAALAKELGISKEKHKRVGNVWGERLAASREVRVKYSGYFMAASRGRFAAAGRADGAALLEGRPLAGPEPVSMDQWTEISARFAARPRGAMSPADVASLLQPYGFTAYEWNIISNWWGRRMSQAATAGDQPLLRRWEEARARAARQAKVE